MPAGSEIKVLITGSILHMKNAQSPYFSTHLSASSRSYYTTSNCTACGVSKTINTGWACNSGYYKSGSSCLKSSSGGSSGGSSSGGGSSSFTCPSGMGRRTCDGMQCCCPPGGDCSRSGVGSCKCLCRR